MDQWPAKWGMTPDEVKAVETVKLITSDAGGLESWEHIDLAGNQCKIQYEFTKNRLFLGVYYCLIDNTISSKSYDTIRADLARQWGKLPNVNANRWVNGRCSITIDARKIDTLDQTMITVSYMEE